jgi:pyrroloquinoline quinone biosynthesis protein D
MDELDRDSRPKIDLASRPALRPHMRLHRDQARDRWVILGPERILTPNETAVSVLQLCNGKRTIAEIAELLAETYDAEPSDLASDIVPMMQGLAKAGVFRS